MVDRQEAATAQLKRVRLIDKISVLTRKWRQAVRDRGHNVQTAVGTEHLLIVEHKVINAGSFLHT